MLTVLLVEDDLDLARTVIEYLELEAIRCDHAGNGVAGLERLRHERYDVVLLDLNLPRLDGIALCRQARSDGNDTPLLMLTARDRLDDKVEGFDAGADDYLVKPFELRELAARIHALARRRSGQARRLRYVGLEMDLDARRASRDGTPLKLSPSGWRLLEALLRAAPAALPRRALEQALWGDEPPDSNALKVHLHHLRKALDGPFGEPLLHTVPGYGFALRSEHDETPAQP
ncbi:response regulator transcription factor [Endothiovibrio diazotrophicus]